MKTREPHIVKLITFPSQDRGRLKLTKPREERERKVFIVFKDVTADFIILKTFHILDSLSHCFFLSCGACTQERHSWNTWKKNLYLAQDKLSEEQTAAIVLCVKWDSRSSVYYSRIIFKQATQRQERKATISSTYRKYLCPIKLIWI